MEHDMMKDKKSAVLCAINKLLELAEDEDEGEEEDEMPKKKGGKLTEYMSKMED